MASEEELCVGDAGGGRFTSIRAWRTFAWKAHGDALSLSSVGEGAPGSRRGGSTHYLPVQWAVGSGAIGGATSGRSLPEIQSALEKLVDRWSRYSGTERSGSQTFLNQLIGAYTGVDDALEAGAAFEQFGLRGGGVGFMDLYRPGVAIIEMKAPKESGRLGTHRAQMLDYWRNSADPAAGTPAPPYLA